MALACAWLGVALALYTLVALIRQSDIVLVIVFGLFVWWVLAGTIAAAMIRSARAARRGATAGWWAMAGCAGCAALFGSFAVHWSTWFADEDRRGYFGFGWNATEVTAESILWWVATAASTTGLALLGVAAVVDAAGPATPATSPPVLSRRAVRTRVASARIRADRPRSLQRCGAGTPSR